MVSKVGQYLRLIRPYGMLFLGFAPVFGAVAGGVTQGSTLWLLFVLGMLYHVFTFVLNDVIDVGVDARSRYVAARPLLEGGVTRLMAVVLVFLSLASLLIVAGVTGSVLTFVFVVVAVSCSAAYNLWSKQAAFLEYVLGFGVFSLVLAGTFAGHGSLTTVAFDVAVAFLLQWVFSVGIAANLKDVEEDTKQGVFTSPTVLGVNFASDRVVLPYGFQLYAWLISVSYILMLGNVFYEGLLNGFIGGVPVAWIGFVIIMVGLFWTTWKILQGPSPSRDAFLRYAGLHEGLALLLVPMTLLTLLLSAIGVTMTVLVFVVIAAWPLAWFRFLYGPRLIPLE